MDEALKLVEHKGITHTIVDIDLNDIKDGYDFLRELRKRDLDLPCIIHSNRYLPEDIERAKRCGARDLVPKPLSIEYLVMFLAGEALFEKNEKVVKEKPKQVILFADDDMIMRMNMEMLVKEISPKIKLLLFESGEDLLEKLKELEACDAIFTDQNLGDGMTGLDLVRKIRELNIQCKTYVISNTLRSEFEDKALEAGANGYFESPVQISDLV